MAWEDIAKFAYGGAFIVGGVGVLYLSKYIPKNFKPIGYIGAAGLGAYGLYSIYKATKEEEPGAPAQPGENYPISIIDPTSGEKWSWSLWHSTNVNVQNPYSVRKRVWVGLSYIEDATGIVFDYEPKVIDINPNSVAKLSWWSYGRPDQKQETGLFWVISSVWDVYPVPPCEETGECHRLGTAESNVTFTLFG